MKPIRSLGICALATITLLALALAAQAVTILDPDNGEKNLYEIVAHPAFGSLTGFGDSSQKFADSYPIVQTLPANVTYNLKAYAKYSSITQDPGTYNPATNVFLSNSLTGSPITTVGISPANITFQETSPFGFFDRLNGGPNLVFANDNPNQGGGNGVIFQISPTHWIVAFEDGGLGSVLGDEDYNDLVLNVTAVPLPPSSLLLGSGLLGLAFWRRFRKS